jgi:hypothetical protein
MISDSIWDPYTMTESVKAAKLAYKVIQLLGFTLLLLIEQYFFNPVNKFKKLLL